MSKRGGQRGMSNLGQRGGDRDRVNNNMYAQPHPLMSYPQPPQPQYPPFSPNPQPMYQYNPPPPPPQMQYPPAPYHVTVTVNQEPRDRREPYYNDRGGDKGGPYYNDRHGERREPYNDRGVDRSEPYNDRGGDRREPYNDRGGDRREPFNDRGGDRREPYNDRHGEQREHYNDRRGVRQEPYNDRHGERREPYYDRPGSHSQHQHASQLEDRYRPPEHFSRGEDYRRQGNSPPPPYVDHRNDRGRHGDAHFPEAPPPYDSVVSDRHHNEGYTRQRTGSTGSDASVSSRRSYKSERRSTPRRDIGPNQSQDPRPNSNKGNDGSHLTDNKTRDFAQHKQKLFGLSMENIAHNLDKNVNLGDDRQRDYNNRGKERGKGRGRGRGRGRGGSQLNSKFSSTPNLVDADQSEAKDKSVKRHPRHRLNKMGYHQADRKPDDKQDINDRSQRTTKAALQILKTFNGVDHLKQTIRQHLDQEENKFLKFVEDSIICSELRGLCTIILTTDSKQMAKKMIKNMCLNLKKSLQVNVTYEMSSTGEDKSPQREDKVIETTWQRSSLTDTKLSSRRKRAEQFLSFASQKAPRIQKLANVQKEKKETEAQAETQSDTRKSPDKDPVAIPTKISVTVGMNLFDKAKVLSFLQSVIDCKVSPFELMEGSVAITSSKSLFDLMAPSKAAAARIVKLLNSLKLGDSTVRAHIVGDSSLKDGTAKSEKLKSVLQSTLDEMRRMSSSALESHNKSIENYERALDAMQKQAPGDEEDEEDVLEELALRDRLMEVIKMRDEFTNQHKELVDRVEKMDTTTASAKDLKDILQIVELNCNRLMTALPILAKRKDILSCVQTNQVLMLTGRTGQGKSTQLVQYLYEAGFATRGRIICSQPRSLAAVLLAEHVSKEMSFKVGGVVGYTTDSKELVSVNTSIIFSTDHFLLNEGIKDPDFKCYSCIIVDESQERSIYTDLLLGMIKSSLPHRPDLKVIIVLCNQSAKHFLDYFNSSTELQVPSRLFPVDVVYESSDIMQELEQYEVKAVAKAISVHKTESQGDILVFLTSPVEIMRCMNELEKRMGEDINCKCFPLHEMLPPAELKKVFEPLPPGVRKIILATSCAENSFTIDGIRFVIDCGLDTEVVYDPQKNISTMSTCVISKSSSDQRKNTAGRTASGKCFRLYSENTYASMEPNRKPKILTEPLGQVILKLAELGTSYEFDFIDAPSKNVLQSTLQMLQYLYAVTPKGITDIGHWLSKFALDPRLGYIIYLGLKGSLLYDCVVLVALIAHGSKIFYRDFSASENQHTFKIKPELVSEYGDLFTWLKIYQEWIKLPRNEQSSWCHDNKINYKVLNFIKHFVSDIDAIFRKENIIMEQQFTTGGDQTWKNLRKIIFFAFTPCTCRYLQDTKDSYLDLIANRHVHVHNSSSLHQLKKYPDWIIYTEFRKTSKSFIKGLMVIDEDWVLDACNQGKLAIDLDKTKGWKAHLAHKEEVGSLLFQHLTGALYVKLQALENSLSSKGMVDVVLEADKQLGTIDIYSASFMNQDAARSLSITKAEVIQKLLEEEEELHIMKSSSGKDQSGVRVLLGHGGLLSAILMPEQSNKIIVTKARSGITVEEVLDKFKLFGDIKEYIKLSHPDHWGHIRYATCHEAQLAVRSTSNDKKLVAILKVESKSKVLKNKFEARLQWTRRPVKGNGTAIIKCPPIERMAFTGKTITVHDRQLTIESSRKEGEVELFCHNIGDVKEYDIKKVLVNMLDYDEKRENNIHVSIVREKVEQMKPEMVKQLKAELFHDLKKYLPTETFNISLISPKPTAIHQVGHIHFDNIEEVLKACKVASGRIFVRGQVVEISPNLKTTIHVSKVIMAAFKSHIEDLVSSFNKELKVMVTLRPMKQGDCAVDITSSCPEYLLQARDKFQKELEGEVIDCTSKEHLSCLLKYKGKQVLKDIEQGQSLMIVTDDRKKKIHIYGDIDNINKAQVEISHFLQMFRDSEREVFALKTPGKPNRILKELFIRYTPFTESIIDTFDLNDVVLDLKQLKITFVGPPKSTQIAMLALRELENGLQNIALVNFGIGKVMPQCVLCKSPIENISELCRLECCGHSYCQICMKGFVAISIQDRLFPMRCIQESCNQFFVARDFKYFINKKWLTKQSLLMSSLDSYVTKYEDTYKFCVTPNCPVVYEVTNNVRGSEWTCPSCSVSVCTSCHTVFHVGLPCRS
uniref:RNA helicase n=1 Tax=Biomphalaria glabrata TaxID=6526 RepID=A0A2C9JL73_BIOGL